MRPAIPFLRHVAPLLLLGVLPFWLAWAGSYSILRDLIGILLWSAVLLLLLRRRHGAAARPPPLAWIGTEFRLRTVALWLAGCWITLGAFDRIFEAPPVERAGGVVSPVGMRADLGGKRISLALSGGGYRAALMHAGVIMELSRQGVPVTNIGAISGGSIIGSFVAAGGDPADFVEAVRAGRFRLKRELTSAFVLPRWLLPLGSYSRRDAQAAMLRRVLLPKDARPGVGPDLVVGATDLVNVASVGFMQEGHLFVGPTTSRFFRDKVAMTIDDLGDLADRVAISGAFPGAFPPKRVGARFTRDPVDLADSPDVVDLRLVLSDGGVRDNLGLNLLEAAHDHATGAARTSSSWPGFQTGSQWAQDLIIVSDGGAAMQSVGDFSWPLGEVMRAIDIASIETGVVRLMDRRRRPPKRVLAMPALISTYPDSTLVLAQPERAAQRYFYFRPGLFSDATLDRMVDLVPDGGVARRALADYRASSQGEPLDIGDADAQCESAPAPATALCSWWRLVTAVGADIEASKTVFLASGTLRDTYSSEEVDALVRLGRYLVLLDWPRLEPCLEAIGKGGPEDICGR